MLMVPRVDPGLFKKVRDATEYAIQLNSLKVVQLKTKLFTTLQVIDETFVRFFALCTSKLVKEAYVKWTYA